MIDSDPGFIIFLIVLFGVLAAIAIASMVFVAGINGRTRFFPQQASPARPSLVNRRQCASEDCGCENPQQANFCRRCGRSLWVPNDVGGPGGMGAQTGAVA